MTEAPAFHQPVLLDAVLTHLGSAQVVFDGTLGGGGHAAALLGRGTRVIGTDRDPAARAVLEQRLAEHIAAGRLRLIADTFAGAAASGALDDTTFDGALLDLGVSSHQLDAEGRGFTFREGAPLDMRMERAGATAAEWLNAAGEGEIADALFHYADERRSRRLARLIVERRARSPFATSDDLVGAIRAALGPRSGVPDFARIFQAVRIAVNDEFGQLAAALPALRDRLAPGGVLVVISYHSGEDRLVKRAFQDWSRDCVCPPRQPMCTCGGRALGGVLTRRPVEASEAEIAANPRARSAKLRAWQRAGGRA